MPSHVSFPKMKPQWIFDRDCVQFFATIDGDQVLKCLVSAEALEAHFGAQGISMGETMRAFNEHRGAIEAVARKKIADGNYKHGDEVLLKIADFPKTGASIKTTLPRPAHGLRTDIDPAIEGDTMLFSGVKEANFVLEHDLATGSRPVTAHWELVQVQPGKALAQLLLTDEETQASVVGLFSAGDLTNLEFTKFSLFRLWDDLLRERGRKQLEAIQAAPGSEGSQ